MKITNSKTKKVITVLILAVISVFQSNAVSLCEKNKVSIRFADSEMKRFPKAYMLDYGKRLYFGYSQGVGCMAMLKMYNYTNNSKYFNYVNEWADSLIDKNGNIYLYEPESYNIDFVNSGKVLLELYNKTKIEKYAKAADLLIYQLSHQPRTSEGGFWHKKVYPSQIWLDGIYMGSPFMAQYGKLFGKSEWIDEAVSQVMLCYKRTLDEKTGLLYHAWDESKLQKWADPQTGHSPNFWGRSIGWFMMATVDVLDYVPVDYPRRAELIEILNKLTEAVCNYQSDKGLWYQVVNLPDKQGNYEEASATSMFMYSIAKAVNKNYIPKKYKKNALNALKGLTKYLIVENQDKTLSLTKCCAVAGLGGNPYRNGSFDYYVNERIRDNDAKATGPFIMGCIELNK